MKKRSLEKMLRDAWLARNWNEAFLLLGLGNLTLYPARMAVGLWIPALILIGGGCAALFLRRRSRKSCAVELDRLAGSGGALEALLEMEESHPLKERLRQETEEAYRTFRPPWSLRLFPLCAGFWIFSFLPFAVPLEVQRQPAVKTEAKTPEKPEEKQGKNIPDFADLQLEVPESEIRAKPLDELEWGGAGVSSRGFRSIALAVYVNGVRKNALPPDSAPDRKGEIRFNGYLALEEFDVKPFDLVSYHLEGIARTAEGERTVLSPPQFIEVRPFREDVLTPDRLPGGADAASRGMEVYSRLSLLLETQIELNKALFSARILKSRKTAEAEKQWKSLYARLCADQKALADELDNLLAREESRRLPADAVNHLELSLAAMRKALAELNRGRVP